MVSEPTGPVVVGVDGSAISLAAVDLAAEEAAALVTPLLVVHVHDGGEVDPGKLREIVTVAVGRARAEHPLLAIGAELTVGDPLDVLLSRALSASLLVVGHRGRYHGGALTLGSVALKVIDRCPVPVIVHRPTDHSVDVPLPRPVLVGVPADRPAEAVVEFAFAEAALRGAPLHAMYVWSGGNGFAVAQEQAARRLTEALTGWAEKYPEVAVRRTVRHSLDAAVALAAASRAAQLVVVGSPQRTGGLPRALVGSVVHALVHRAGCPVAVVRAD
jgi:nucleotide-binding universal stress UspA family protein